MIDKDPLAFIGPSERIRPLRDNLVLEPMEWDASAIIIAIRYGRPVRGRVIAAGPGAYRKIWAKDRSKYWDTETFVPTEVKVGDVVELGGLNVFDGAGYAFPPVMVNGQKHIIVSEKDVAIVREAK